MLRPHQSADSVPQIRIPILYSPHMLPTAAVCPVHLSPASWVSEEELTAAAAEHGHGVTQIEHVHQHYTIASAHCALCVSLPSAELNLMISVSPRIFGGEPSTSVRGSQEFLRICVHRRPSAHLCRRLPWPSARCGESHVGTSKDTASGRSDMELKLSRPFVWSISGGK